MAKKRTSKPAAAEQIPLAQPDRTANPSKETLINWAQSADLFKDPSSKSTSKTPSITKIHGEDEDADEEDYQVGRLAEAVLWSLSLAMAHFTLDFLIQYQYAQEMEIWKLGIRALQALPVILIFFYMLHPHPKESILPGLFPISEGNEDDARAVLFFVASVAAGCYSIHITNAYPYYAVMKQAPPVIVGWIWSVVELSLIPATVSLLCCLVFLFWGNYAFL